MFQPKQNLPPPKFKPKSINKKRTEFSPFFVVEGESVGKSIIMCETNKDMVLLFILHGAIIDTLIYLYFTKLCHVLDRIEEC